MSWDLDFGTDDSFTTNFDDADSMFFAGTDSISDTSFEAPFLQPETEYSQLVIPQQIQQTPLQPYQNTSKISIPDQNILAEENTHLKQFVTSLKEKAEQAEDLNLQLRKQLENCRNWFKDAMFSGISTHK